MKYKLKTAVLVICIVAIVALTGAMMGISCTDGGQNPYATAKMAVAAIEGIYPALANTVKQGCSTGAIEPDVCKNFNEKIDPTIKQAIPMLYDVIDIVERFDKRPGQEKPELPPGASPGIPESGGTP